MASTGGEYNGVPPPETTSGDQNQGLGQGVHMNAMTGVHGMHGWEGGSPGCNAAKRLL